MFNLSVLPLSRQLTALSGFQWGKVLRGGRAQRIEYLLLHEFHAKKFIVPDKTYGSKDKAKGKPKGKGPQYAGGLVLDPKCGLYDDYVLMRESSEAPPMYRICVRPH